MPNVPVSIAAAAAALAAALAALGARLTSPAPPVVHSQCIMVVGDFEAKQFNADSIYVIKQDGSYEHNKAIWVSTTEPVPPEYVNRNIQFCMNGQIDWSRVLPSNQLASVLCDSLVLVHHTKDNRYYVLHTVGADPSLRKDTVWRTPTTITGDSARAYPWVGVAIIEDTAQGKQGLLKTAYLPGDTEVLRRQCFNSNTIEFR